MVELRIPNKEIKEIFESTVRKWFEDSTRVMNRKTLFDAVWNKDTDKLTKEISTLLQMTEKISIMHFLQESLQELVIVWSLTGNMEKDEVIL